MERDVRTKIWLKDIKELILKIQVNDMIKIEITSDTMGEKLTSPIIQKRRVVAKYPHLVELDRQGSQIDTLTYVDLLTGQGGKLDV